MARFLVERFSPSKSDERIVFMEDFISPGIPEIPIPLVVARALRDAKMLDKGVRLKAVRRDGGKLVVSPSTGPWHSLAISFARSSR